MTASRENVLKLFKYRCLGVLPGSYIPHYLPRSEAADRWRIYRLRRQVVYRLLDDLRGGQVVHRLLGDLTKVSLVVNIFSFKLR